MTREERTERYQQRKKIAKEQYNALTCHDICNGNVCYAIETKFLEYYTNSLHFYWHNLEDAIRYYKEQIAEKNCRVVKMWYVANENTLYTEEVQI